MTDDNVRALELIRIDARRLWAQVQEIDQRLSVGLTPNEIRVVCRALGELVAANEPDRDAASEIWNRLQKAYRP